MSVLIRLGWALVGAILFCNVAARAGVGLEEAAALLPDKLGNFTAQGPPLTATDGVTRRYRAPKGEVLTVELLPASSENGGYALFTKRSLAASASFSGPAKFDRTGRLGTVSVAWPGRVHFFKSTNFVAVTAQKTRAEDNLSSLAQELASKLDAGEGEIPSLIKHLPDWERAQDRALYADSPALLEEFAGPQPVFAALNWQGGAEAVVAAYDPAKLVIVEFTTPQLATVNDNAIQAKLKELQSGGQSLPTLYRRVGNYGVFVFDAPDTAAAEQLAGQIKYEKTVQWLGDNPYPLINAQKRYISVTTDVFLSVVKASGLAIVLALGVGGLIGALVFKRRRAQQAVTDLYSDAGGMMRLNLDELTPDTEDVKCLKP